MRRESSERILARIGSARPRDVRKAFRYAFENIKPTDMVDVGMFQKYKNQVAENAAFVREILEA